MKEFFRSVKMFFLFSLITGILYPLLIAGIAQTFFKREANGSLIEKNGTVIGSELIGQQFTKSYYFHGRPSAADYDATNSNGSNFGPTNAKFIDAVAKNIEKERKLDNLSGNEPVPADLILSSGSGLDPDISPDAAFIQISRVARARGISENELQRIVRKHVEISWLGIWGEPRLNVLKLNLDLDSLHPVK